MTALHDETAHIARAVAALGDRFATAPKESPFFDQACRDAIKGKTDAITLDILMRRIADAEYAKARGGGPPLDDINKVRRLWLDIYAREYGRAA
jgi:hypothetical protein